MLEHEKNLKPDIQKALDMIVPDESSKDRMYLEIMRRAAVQETKAKKKPWYTRWQVSAGICTAAMACVVVAAASLHSRIPVDTKGELSVVTPMETSSAVVDIEDVETTAASAVNQKQTQTQAQTQTTAASTEQATETAAMTAGVVETTPTKQAVPVQTAAAVLPAQNPTTTAAAETKPVQTTVSPQKTIPAPGANVTDATAPAETTVTAAITSDVPLRQNIYLYYELNYHDVNYSTQYETISGRQLTYLGSGVTSGADVEDMHTVLIYAIDGVDASQQLAVQYAGETAYYLFHAVSE